MSLYPGTSVGTFPGNSRSAPLDALRGFALAGIVLVNAKDILRASIGDQRLFDTLNLFVQGRFHPIFAFLFGAGISIFLENARRRGDGSRAMMFRRLGILLILGIAHTWVYPGEALLGYAIVGLLVMWLDRIPQPALIALGLLTLIPAAGFVGGVAMVPGFILLGMAIGRTDVLRRPTEYRTALGIALAVATTAAVTFFLLVPESRGSAQLFPMPAVLGLLMAAAYVSAFLLLAPTAPGRPLTRLLAPFGRMALTNYLTQTLLLLTVKATFLPAQPGHAFALSVAVVIVLVQIPLSHWWLRHHAQGPIEALWRKLTYYRRRQAAPRSSTDESGHTLPAK